MAEENRLKTGTVKSFSEERQYGFISVDGGYTNGEGFQARDIFFHESGMTYRVQTGDEVSFRIEMGKKGLMAVEVKRK